MNYTFNTTFNKEDNEKGAVDKNEKIKFMAVGYSGNNGLELQKLGMMIELAGRGELAAN